MNRSITSQFTAGYFVLRLIEAEQIIVEKYNFSTHVLEHYPIGNEKNFIVCVLTGSDGGNKWARQISKQLNKYAIPACALAYWKYKNLPKVLSLIPVEAVEAAVQHLKGYGYNKVYLYGFSKGAELALLSVSIYSDIDGVIAISPSCAIFEGFSQRGYSNHSAWVYRGIELPYIAFNKKKLNMLKMYLSQRGYAFLRNFEAAFLEQFSDENRIKVENANCPILLISAINDSMWPSTVMGEQIISKLKDVHYPYSYQHIVFEKASHVLCPVKSFVLKVFPQERLYSKDCEQSRMLALNAAVNWIRSNE